MIDNNLTYKCWEAKDVGFPDRCKKGKLIPKLSTKGGPKRVIGRTILESCPFLGSYGMGGPGFFGFKLEAKGQYKEEWLVLTMWSADSWLLLNGLWLSCHPDFRKTHLDRCYFKKYSSFFDDQSKQINDVFYGFVIKSFKIGTKSFKMKLINTNENLVLELPSKLSLLSPYGNEEKRKWNNKEKMEDGFIISNTKYINM